jgi:hypothetical protein
LFQGSTPGCGFANWPTFGLVAAKWTWRFDFQQQYIGSGFLVPHVVAWSMLLGAILSWGIMWPHLTVSGYLHALFATMFFERLCTACPAINRCCCILLLWVGPLQMHLKHTHTHPLAP